MKLISYINQNIPYWSVIKGDHACDDRNLLHSSLMKKPDFLDPRENALRKAFLQNAKGRKWLCDYFENKSFGLVELEKSDLENVLSVWKELPLLEIAKQYKKAYALGGSVSYKKLEKPEAAVLDVKRRKQVLVKTSTSGLDWLINPEESFDYHRTIWLKRRKDNKYQIIDGTHRTLATTWHYLLDKKTMPQHPWYAIVCVD